MSNERKPKQRLFGIELSEISLVDAGDNPGAHQLIRKRKKDGMSFFEKLGSWVGLSKNKSSDPEVFTKRFESIKQDLSGSLIAAHSESDADTATSLAQVAVDNFMDDADKLIGSSEGEHVDATRAMVEALAEAASQDLAGESGDKLADALEAIIDFEVPKTTETDKSEEEMAIEATPEAILAAIDAMDESQRAELVEKIAPAKEEAKDPVETVKAKANDEEKAAIEKVEQEKQDLAKRVAELEARDKRAAMVERVKSTQVGFDADKLTEAMLAVPAEQANVIFEALSAAGAQSKLTEQIGTSQDGDAVSKLEARIEEIQQEKGILKSQAAAEAMKELSREKALG